MSDEVVSNARLIAELQAVSIAVRLFGLDKLPDVLGRDKKPLDCPYDPTTVASSHSKGRNQ